jgi:acyl dehydratase
MNKLTVDRERVARWARVVDDHNPLHIDAEYAATTRFEVPIVHGSLLFALVCNAAQQAGLDGALTIRFRDPVPVGATVAVSADRTGVVLSYDDTMPVEVLHGRELDAWP